LIKISHNFLKKISSFDWSFKRLFFSSRGSALGPSSVFYRFFTLIKPLIAHPSSIPQRDHTRGLGEPGKKQFHDACLFFKIQLPVFPSLLFLFMNTPLTRRHFFQATAASVSLAPLARALEASATLQGSTGPEEIAILNDTHINAELPPGQGSLRVREQHPSNLRQAIREILARVQRPAAVIINGDLAMSVGVEADYKAFGELIAPLSEAGLPVHLTLGNHDTREAFLKSFPKLVSASNFKEHRHNGLIDLPNTRLILLDSLKESPAAPGRLGDEQIGWLLSKIDETPQKAVVLVAHHNPKVGGDPLHFPGGVEDTEAFWPEVVKRTQVKAYIHGHVHDWTLAAHTGIHIINTLAVSFVGNPALSTTGWTLASFHPEAVELNIQTTQRAHPWANERKWLFWRQTKRA